MLIPHSSPPYQSTCLQRELLIDYKMLLFWFAAEVGSPEDISGIEVFFIYYIIINLVSKHIHAASIYTIRR